MEHGMSFNGFAARPSYSTPADDWQLLAGHCPEQFLPLGGSPEMQRRLARWEAEQIACFTNPRHLVCVRARALRYVAELRGCSIRQIVQFFDVPLEVVVAALSLLAIPAAAERPALIQAA